VLLPTSHRCWPRRCWPTCPPCCHLSSPGCVHAARLEAECMDKALKVIKSALSSSDERLKVGTAFRILEHVAGKPSNNSNDPRGTGQQLANAFAIELRRIYESGVEPPQRQLESSEVPTIDGVHVIRVRAGASEGNSAGDVPEVSGQASRTEEHSSQGRTTVKSDDFPND